MIFTSCQCTKSALRESKFLKGNMSIVYQEREEEANQQIP